MKLSGEGAEKGPPPHPLPSLHTAAWYFLPSHARRPLIPGGWNLWLGLWWPWAQGRGRPCGWARGGRGSRGHRGVGGPGDEATGGVVGPPQHILLVPDDFPLFSVSFISFPQYSLPSLPSHQLSSPLDTRVLGSPQAKGHALGLLVFCASCSFLHRAAPCLSPSPPSPGPCLHRCSSGQAHWHGWRSSEMNKPAGT